MAFYCVCIIYEKLKLVVKNFKIPVSVSRYDAVGANYSKFMYSLSTRKMELPHAIHNFHLECRPPEILRS